MYKRQVLGDSLGTLAASAGQLVPGGMADLCVFDPAASWTCLLYTSDAADDLLRVDLGGRRII